ncbi:MAG TPA: S41 family peptidase, partial [Candidatus Acidoferrum sp.]|nr:S41 family peptidase [Candidatus Acidoferrum sp.]
SSISRLLIFFGAVVVTTDAFSAARPEPPPFNEVRDLIRTNAAGLTPAEFNRASIEGLLAKLETRAWILDDPQAAVPTRDTNTVTLAASALFDDQYGYLRISRVGAELPQQFTRALTQMAATNTLKGLAIDLRFADGTDYAAAAAVADHFIPRGQKLFEWSGGTANSHDKTNAFRGPVTVLVNHFTAGAAEALAAVLRETDVALIIGTNTAGLASATKDFPLSNGQTLRVATQPLKLANGGELLSLKPDILVEVSPDDERAYFVDAYRMLPRSGFEGSNTNVVSLSITNKGPRRRINEAELVRMSREGIDPDEEAKSSRPATPGKPVIADPALARAVDLLKALAIVRHTRY